MKIAILTPIHGVSFEKSRLQLDNYVTYLGCDASIRFYYHVSKESSLELRNDLNLLKEFSSYDIRIAENSRQTSTKTCLNALLELSILVSNDSWCPDYILWHSDSDLLIRTGLSEEIKKYDFGVGIHDFSYNTVDWPHAELMRQDPRFNLFIEGCLGGKISNLRIGRTEGCFMNADIWNQIATQLQTYFDNDYFDLVSNHWCAEEILLPSLLNLVKKENTSCRRQLIYTKPAVPDINRSPEDSKITIQDILKLRLDNCYYGAKWFSASPADDARVFLTKNN
jgi:hypothetical protein